MSILVDKTTRVLVQGMGKAVTFHPSGERPRQTPPDVTDAAKKVVAAAK